MAFSLRFLDIRPAETRAVATSFGGLLFIVVAHTTLETVRDATFLAHVGARGLGYMYIVTAALTLAAGAVSSGIGARLGVRRALVATLAASAVGAGSFCFLPPTSGVLTALYAFSAVSGALLVPQLWATTAASFHAGQGRRLFGTIAVSGLLGAVFGTLATAGALLLVDIRWLFLVSGAGFFVAAVIVSFAPASRAAPRAAKEDRDTWWSAFRAEPFLLRLALVVALGTFTTLFVDYLFKAVAAAHVPADGLGSFFARYYLAMNVLALVVQIAFARRLLARAGVVGAAGVMPGLMLMGSIVGFLTGGAFFALMATRAVDGALRHSVQRTSLELLYLAVPSRARARAKPIIDGALTRLSQAAAAAVILFVANVGHGSPRLVAFIAMACAVGWASATLALRGPYVALFRRALLGPDHEEPRTEAELDLASVELLVEALSSANAREAIAAVDALARRGRAGLVPALVLLRDEPEVLERALELFASTPRTDWLRFCDRLIADKRERVHRATLRALARARVQAAEERAADEQPWIRGYLATFAVARGALPAGDALALARGDADARGGMLTALGDADANPRLAELLASVVDGLPEHVEPGTVELVARAAAKVGAVALVPWLVDALAQHDTRGADTPHRLWRGPAEARGVLRASLAALGEPAFDAVRARLLDRATPRRLRIHLPLALAEHKTREAVDALLVYVQDGDDGHVRYRSLRALERLVTESGMRVTRKDARRLAARELTEHFRLLALRSGIDPSRSSARRAIEGTRDVVLALLDDKCAQALGRAFRMLKLCYPAEDLLQVHAAVTSADAATRANAIEFLDALLAPRRRSDHDGVRALLRLVVEELPDAERVARAGVVPAASIPSGAEAAVRLLREDRDPLLASVATSLAEEHGWLHTREPATANAEGEGALAGALRPAGAHGQ